MVNFYHHVSRRGHGLCRLLDFDLSPTTPCLITGDFNSHSHVWLLPHTPASPWAQDLESWFLVQDLTILNPPLLPTWQNALESCSLVIDLMAVNSAELLHWPVQLACDVSFLDARDMDHAALSLAIPILTPPPPPSVPPITGWYVDPLVRDCWIELFHLFSFPTSCDSRDQLLALWHAVRSAIEQVSNSLFATRGGSSHHPGALPWWNSACHDAVLALHVASPADQQCA